MKSLEKFKSSKLQVSAIQSIYGGIVATMQICQMDTAPTTPSDCYDHVQQMSSDDGTYISQSNMNCC